MSVIPKYLQRNVFTFVFVLFVSSAWGQSASMEELYKKALKEGGSLNFYGTLAQINAEKILPVFEKRFPGVKINHVDATSDKLVTRAISEARGGKTIADVLQVNQSDLVQAHEQKLLLELVIPEAGEYPDGMKGSFWVSQIWTFTSPAGTPTSLRKTRSRSNLKTLPILNGKTA